MAGVNKVILVGNLGKDPEVRHLEGGSVVANFSLATSDSYTDRNTGQRVTQTEWHNVVLWRGLAQIAEKYLRKGRQVYIEGKLRTRQWTDRDGNTRYTTEIVGEEMTLLGSRQENEAMGNNSTSTAPQMPTPAKTPVAQPQAPKAEPVLPGATAEDDMPF